jgi:hypothetical protein
MSIGNCLGRSTGSNRIFKGAAARKQAQEELLIEIGNKDFS